MGDQNIFFPDMQNKHILMDDVSKYSITLPDKAEIISEIIKKNYQLKYSDDNIDELVITDAMACIGGNTLSFSTYFKNVNANELNTTRFQYLVHNMKQYEKTNILFYNDNYLNIIHKLKQHIVFIDPPWGGPIYKSQYKMDIMIQHDQENQEENIISEIKEVRLDEMIDNIFLDPMTKMIVYKLPTNHNIDNFKKYNYKMMCLKNMLLIMIFTPVKI
jgi:16S rRNA G966 N2-methylase RsmD